MRKAYKNSLRFQNTTLPLGERREENPLIAVMILLIIPCFCFADTIHVPGDQPTIQAGIDAAVTGDIVLVAAGTYFENIDFFGKAITIKSSHGAWVTHIDGQKNGCVVSFQSNEGLDSIIDGFTICNGQDVEGVHEYGSGVLCMSASPTIINNQITGNVSGAEHSY